MKACATAGGGVFFIPEKVERKKITLKKCSPNDNDGVSECKKSEKESASKA